LLSLKIEAAAQDVLPQLVQRCAPRAVAAS